MSSVAWMIVAVLAAVVIPAVVSVSIRVLRLRIRGPRKVQESPTPKCSCGYDLTGLEIPRCPECGRAIGFDKSFEELGLTQDELARIGHVWQERQQARQADSDR
jgi:hypothetical protein